MNHFSEHSIDAKGIHPQGKEFGKFIESMPALFWRINVVKKSIEYLNEFELPELGKKSNLLLQNKAYAREVVLPEDGYKLLDFIQEINERKYIHTVIRVHTDKGSIRWLKLMGIPDPHDYTFIHGYIMDITESVNEIISMDSEWGGVANRIELFSFPVLLMTMSDLSFYAINSAAAELFSAREKTGLSLKDIIAPNEAAHIPSIFEHLIFNDSWESELCFITGSGEAFRARTGIRPLVADGKQLIWVALYQSVNITSRAPEVMPPQDDIAAFRARIHAEADNGSMPGMLQSLLSHQPGGEYTDSIIFSHISDGKDIVMVWGAGSSFSNLEGGTVYTYEGTIAENIESFGLPFLIVDDTMESIKPIDWALFIPNGIRSYIAVPFYKDSILKTVLIFCSRYPSQYSDDYIEVYRYLYETFNESLQLWKSKVASSLILP